MQPIKQKRIHLKEIPYIGELEEKKMSTCYIKKKKLCVIFQSLKCDCTKI